MFQNIGESAFLNRTKQIYFALLSSEFLLNVLDLSCAGVKLKGGQIVASKAANRPSFSLKHAFTHIINKI